MANDPKYVRLGNSHVHGMLADVTERRSLWHIAGLEVKRFPDDTDPEAQAFVRDKIRMGMLEAASVNEYDEQQDAADAIRQNHLQTLGERLQSDKSDIQEAPIQDIVRQTQHSILSRRVDGETEDEEEGESEANKQASAKAKVPAGGGGNQQ